MQRKLTLVTTLLLLTIAMSALPASASDPQPHSAQPAQTAKSPDATCPPDGQCFADVLPGNVFYDFVNRIFQQDLVTGYPCGGPGEPCDPEGRPYYRPINNVTRQQMAKFIDNARHDPGIEIDSTGGTIPISASNGSGVGLSATGTTAGIKGVSHVPNGYGVQGTVDNGAGSAGVYGLSNAANGAGVVGRADTGSNAFGVSGTSANGYGVYGTGGSTGVYGNGTTYGVRGVTSNGSGYGLSGLDSGTNGTGVLGSAPNGGAATGVYGSAANGQGVYGTGYFGVEGSGSSVGVYGTTNTGTGVYGNGGSTGVLGSGSTYGVNGTSSTGTGVKGTGSFGLYGSGNGTEAAGVYGVGTDNAYGVHGHTSTGYAAVWGDSAGTGGVGVLGDASTGNNAIGVYGRSSGYGVYGESAGANGYGVNGVSPNGYGVIGLSDNGTGVFGSGGQYAGFFDGDTRVGGDLYVFGDCIGCLGSSRIDDPLDPANKYLIKSAVESPDMLDVLSGNATTDAQGNATISLPSYFQTATRDFRYQLTIVGDQFAQVRVSSKLKDNVFSIQTDKPNIEVSWQVTGVRNDPYAKDHPITVEQDKPADEKGTYLYPKGYGQPDSKGVGYERQQQMKQMAQPASNPPKTPDR